MNFRRLNISDKAFYDGFLSADTFINSRYAASELNFANLFCWNVSDNIFCCPTEDAIFVMAKDGENVYFLPPLVKRDADFVPALSRIGDWFRGEGLRLDVRSVTPEMLEVMGDERLRYEIAYDRDYSEYLYDPQSLISLSGKKLAQKRNHLNYFLQNFDYEFRPFRMEDRQEVINLVQEWKVVSGNTEILEQIAIDNAIAYYGELGLVCDVLRVEGRLAAFSMGFVNRNNVGIVMFEKADAGIRGSFQAINNFFVRDRLSGCRLVNRQEDMGIEGLRRAKLGYCPVAMADKYCLTEKGNGR